MPPRTRLQAKQTEEKDEKNEKPEAVCVLVEEFEDGSEGYEYDDIGEDSLEAYLEWFKPAFYDLLEYQLGHGLDVHVYIIVDLRLPQGKDMVDDLHIPSFHHTIRPGEDISEFIQHRFNEVTQQYTKVQPIKNPTVHLRPSGICVVIRKYEHIVSTAEAFCNWILDQNASK